MTSNFDNEPRSGGTASVVWLENGTPVSTRFDDHYYETREGREETREVFLGGNRLPQRWQNRDGFVIAELGFGTGLNFFETVNLWQRTAQPGATLRYISTEQFPLKPMEIAKAMRRWPDLGPSVDLLLEHWTAEALHEAGVLMLSVDLRDRARVQLFVHFGDAREIVPRFGLAPVLDARPLVGRRALIDRCRRLAWCQLRRDERPTKPLTLLVAFMSRLNCQRPRLAQQFRRDRPLARPPFVDAWYLDGFSPAKNPEMWDEALMRHVGELTVPGGTFSTYTAAGWVRRNLAAAGFQVEKVRGFGRKRERLQGVMAGRDAVSPQVQSRER